jgi:hypothetical protein
MCGGKRIDQLVKTSADFLYVSLLDHFLERLTVDAGRNRRRHAQ